MEVEQSEPVRSPEGELVAKPPVDLSELFSRDPLKLSDQDLDLIISTMRSSRQQWSIAEAQAKRDGKSVRSKVATAPKRSAAELKSLSLDDIL